MSSSALLHRSLRTARHTLPTGAIPLSHHRDGGGMLIRCKSTRPLSSSASRFLESATELWTALRWKAVQQVTESLSPEEREAILQRWNPSGVSTTSSTDTTPDTSAQSPQQNDSWNTHSIAEAVAQARMEEAQRWQSQWERDRTALMQQAEAAAQARMEQDLVVQRRKVQFELWQQQVQDEKEKSLSKQQQSSSSEIEASVLNVQSEPPMDATETFESASAVATTATQLNVHPILGPTLVDLGYKRLHTVSAKSLSDILVWEKQRIYRHDRAKVMAADKLKTLHLGMPGVIALYEVGFYLGDVCIVCDACVICSCNDSYT
jgi:hypothetical protein